MTLLGLINVVLLIIPVKKVPRNKEKGRFIVYCTIDLFLFHEFRYLATLVSFFQNRAMINR